MVPRQNKRAADMVQLDGSDSAQQPQYQQQLVSVPEPWAARLNRHQIYYEPVAPAASSSSSILPAMSISSKHLQGNVPSSWSYSAPVTTAATLMRSKHQDILIPAASTPSSLRNMDIPNVSPKSTTTLRSVRVSQEIQSTTSATWLYPKDPLFMPMSRETFFLQQQQQQQALMNNRSMMTDTIKSAETTTRDFTIDEVGREDVFIDLLSSMTNVQEMTSSPEEGVDTQQTTRSNVRSLAFVPQPGLSGDDDLALSVPAHRSPIAASGPQTLSDPFHPRRRSERIEGLPGNGRIPITYLLYAPLNPYTQQIDNTDAAAKTHHHNLRPRLGRSSMTNQSNKDSVHKKLVKFMDDKKNSGHPGDGNDSDDSDDLDDDHSPLTKTQRSRAPSPITTVTTSPKATTGLTVVGRRLRKLAAGAKNDKSSTLLVSQTSNQDEKSTSGLYQELIAFHQHNLRTRSGRSMTMALMSDIKKESTIAGNELGVDRNALANTAHEQEETWIKTKETAVMEDPSSEGCRGRDILHPVRNKKSAAADADDDEDGQLELMPEILEGVDLLPQYPRFFAVHKASATAPDSPTSPPSSLSLSSRSQAQAVFNEPRSDQDLYTPRWTKGRGPEKIGLCPICMPEIELWQKMKCSAYWYHMHYHHGVCASTGVMLPAPEKIEFQDADFLKSQQHQQRNPNRARPHVLALSSSSALPLSKAPTSTNNSLANVDNGDHQSVMTKAKVIEMLSVSGSTEYQELVAAAASELGWIPAAYCDICLRWIPLEGLNRDSGAIPEILWWKHAQQCQKILLRAVARS
ncbi:hypothetical protein BGZ83_009618 [Gryganskiella cystojenkinii]|nr:hypothetical protein BGZ83_009618 [Gryganskiella cystojenkinii]